MHSIDRTSHVLASATTGSKMRRSSNRLDETDAAWLAAVGLHEGEEVVVLRRAALGGPLHVRTSSGGEFAVARELALRLDVVTADEEQAAGTAVSTTSPTGTPKRSTIALVGRPNSGKSSLYNRMTGGNASAITRRHGRRARGRADAPVRYAGGSRSSGSTRSEASVAQDTDEGVARTFLDAFANAQRRAAAPSSWSCR